MGSKAISGTYDGMGMKSHLHQLRRGRGTPSEGFLGGRKSVYDWPAQEKFQCETEPQTKDEPQKWKDVKKKKIRRAL